MAAPVEDESVLHIITGRAGNDDDVALISTPGDRRNSLDHLMQRKSTLILDNDLEDELGNSQQGRSFLAWLGSTVLGTLTQFLLLVACIGLYTFTPEVISWSKQVSIGMSGVVLPSSHSIAFSLADELPDHLSKRVDPPSGMSQIALREENWPSSPEDQWAGDFTIKWSGKLNVPKQGKYRFALRYGDSDELKDSIHMSSSVRVMAWEDSRKVEAQCSLGGDNCNLAVSPGTVAARSASPASHRRAFSTEAAVLAEDDLEPPQSPTLGAAIRHAAGRPPSTSEASWAEVGGVPESTSSISEPKWYTESALLDPSSELYIEVYVAMLPRAFPENAKKTDAGNVVELVAWEATSSPTLPTSYHAMVVRDYDVPPPDAIVVPKSWVSIDPQVSKPYKGQPYLDATPTLVNKLTIIPMALVIAYLSGGKEQVKLCFSPSLIMSFAPCAVCYAIADVAEILANSGLDPTTYIILSQSRLLLTALVMKIVIGTQQTTPQWLDLCALSLLICIFQFTPMDFMHPENKSTGPGGDARLGLICTFVKIILSVGAGVYIQRIMQAGSKTPFAAQLVAMQLPGFVAACILLPVTCWITGTMDTLLNDGPFAGPDGSWNYRTLAVVGAYHLREWITNLVVKRFDALVKNICNAAACIVSYAFGMFITGNITGLFVGDRLNRACFSKICVIMGVVLLVTNYSLGKLYVRKETKG